MLVIADAGRAAGGGGRDGRRRVGGVGAAPRAVALESAYFLPSSVRRTSKRLGLKTEASARFERGADVNCRASAMERACALLAQIGAGRLRGAIVDCYPAPARAGARSPCGASASRACSATTVDDERGGARSSRGLGFPGRRRPPRGWEVTVPTRRVDITREADLIEELARHHGFDRLPRPSRRCREAARRPTRASRAIGCCGAC